MFSPGYFHELASPVCQHHCLSLKQIIISTYMHIGEKTHIYIYMCMYINIQMRVCERIIQTNIKFAGLNLKMKYESVSIFALLIMVKYTVNIN